MTQILTIPAEQYHADNISPAPALSASLIKTLLGRSPAHAWLEHPRLNPDHEPSESNTRMDIGSAAHALLLEGRNAVVTVDAKDWRTKAAQEARDEARAQGKYPVLTDQVQDIFKMAEIAEKAILDRLGVKIRSQGNPEQSIFWQESSGISCKARPDWLSLKSDLIIDYKTTELTPAAWVRGIAKYGYDIQEAWYRRAVPGARFIFVIQEVTAPFSVYFVELSGAYKAMGEEKVRMALDLWNMCFEHDAWPGYPQEIIVADPLPWELADVEEKANLPHAGWGKEAFLFGKVGGKK